jgi:hypothetical protein
LDYGWSKIPIKREAKVMSIFIIGSFWFWALIVVATILLFVYDHVESGLGSTIVLLVSFACLQWLGNVDLLGTIISHPWKISGAVIMYFIAGMIWGTFRWYLFCMDIREQYLKLKENWDLERKSHPELLPWEDYVRRMISTEIPPKAYKHKATIIRHMSYWLVDIIWWCVSDFVVRICKIIYQHISAFLQKISDRVFADIINDNK